MVAIICLAGLEAMAMYKEIDGAYFMPVVALIATIAGVALPSIFKSKNGP